MAYTFVAMRIELQRRLGGRTDSTSQTRAAEFLNSAQLKLAEANFAIMAFEEVGQVTFVEDQPEINLLSATPSFPLSSAINIDRDVVPPAVSSADQMTYVNNLQDLIGIRLVQRLPQEANTSDVGWRMARMSWAEWREIQRTQASGPPTRWARNGYRLAVDPKPDALYTIQLDYRRRPLLDVVEVEGEWQEHMLCLAESIGWRAFGQPDMAVGALQMLPANVLRILQSPLDSAEWDALWDDDLALQPRMG